MRVWSTGLQHWNRPEGGEEGGGREDREGRREEGEEGAREGGGGTFATKTTCILYIIMF